MSKRFDVVTAAKALVQGALPAVSVRGLDNAADFPAVIPPNGVAVVREGSLGAPDVDLSPLTYTYEHRIPVELAASSPAALDAMLCAIGTALIINRHLGGLCDWLEAEAPDPEAIAAAGQSGGRGVILILVAIYSTTDPLN